MARRWAMHVRTGDPALAAEVDGWLGRNDLFVSHHGDPFSVLARVLAPSQPCELIFIGLDLLAPDESSLLSYARTRWPGVLALQYGSTVDGRPPETMRGALWCRDGAALREALQDDFAALTTRLRQAGSPIWRPPGSAGGPRAADAVPGREPRTAPPIAPSTIVAASSAAAASVAATGRAEQADVMNVVEPPVGRAPRKVLTERELQILLDDTEH